MGCDGFTPYSLCACREMTSTVIRHNGWRHGPGCPGWDPAVEQNPDAFIWNAEEENFNDQ